MPPSATLATSTGSRSGDDTWRRYGEYLRRPPILSVEWSDQETGARGWLVINSLRGGAAGGGTRMREGLTRREVIYLAKAMELKFLFSGPPIGGAKSGIDFDPADPRRHQVLRRWFRAISPYLRTCYGTGGDLNVDEMLDVVPCCTEIGLTHPQEGVVRGHLRPDGAGLLAILDSLDQGVRAPVRDEYGARGIGLSISDLVTGYGVARSVIHLYASRGRSVAGERVLLEGFGAVGGPCALYLARAGARVVGISDREKALVVSDGLGAAEVADLLGAREEKCIPRGDPRCLYGPERAVFGAVPADVFVSAAASETLNAPRLEQLASQGVHTIACGANQPFREAKLGATRVQRMADSRFTVIPDILANCGMARAFNYLMQSPGHTETAPVFEAVDATISAALAEITRRNQHRTSGLLAATLEYALDRVAAEDSTS
jgi:glutamate dehydrogenase/leucine dehydrogenase